MIHCLRNYVEVEVGVDIEVAVNVENDKFQI